MYFFMDDRHAHLIGDCLSLSAVGDCSSEVHFSKVHHGEPYLKQSRIRTHFEMNTFPLDDAHNN